MANNLNKLSDLYSVSELLNQKIENEYQKKLLQLPKDERIEFLKQQPKAIGERLRRLRKEKKWTQGQVADFLKTTKQNISNYENGTYAIPFERLNELSELYETDLSYIIGSPESLGSSKPDEIKELLQLMNSLNPQSFNLLNNEIKKKFGSELDEKEWIYNMVIDLLESATIEQLYEIKDDIIFNLIKHLNK